MLTLLAESVRLLDVQLCTVAIQQCLWVAEAVNVAGAVDALITLLSVHRLAAVLYAAAMPLRRACSGIRCI